MVPCFLPSIKRGCLEGTGVCGIVKLSKGSLNKCGMLLLDKQHPLLSPFPNNGTSVGLWGGRSESVRWQVGSGG